MRTTARFVPLLLSPRVLSVLALGAVLTPSALAQCTTTVPSNPNPVLAGLALQGAINSAMPGDVICIDPGTYEHNFTLSKDITLQPSGASQSVILDGGGSGTVLTITSTTTAAQVLDLVIRNGNSPGDGGGIHIDKASPQIVGCRVENNVAVGRGGGIYVFGELTAPAIPTIRASQIVGNTAVGSGGGIAYWGLTGDLMTGVNSIVTNTTIRLNSAGSPGSPAYGGGIFLGLNTGLGGNPRASIFRSRVSENLVDGSGGGIAGFFDVQLIVDHCTVGLNSATEDGGGIWCNDGCTLNVRSCYLPENQASFRGGGIFVFKYNEGDIRHCVIDHNSLSAPFSRGGGVYLSNSGGNYNGGNKADGSVPPPMAGDPPKFYVQNNLIVGNESGNGAGTTVEYATPRFVFNTFEGNVAHTDATGGMLVDNYDPAGFVVPLRILNSIYWGDMGTTTPTEPWQVEFLDMNTLSELEHNDVRFRSLGTWPYHVSNIDADPLWTTGYTCPLSPIDGYFLSQPSPLQLCVDAGSALLSAFPYMNGRVTNPAAATLPTPPTALDTGTADLGYHYPQATCP